MEVRLLKVDEWDKLLACCEPAKVPSPKTAAVVVAMEGGQIIGYWILQLVLSAEPCWVAEQHRGSMAVGLMFTALENELRQAGISSYMTHSSTAEIAGYLKRLGFTETNWTAFTKEVAPCHS